MRYNVCMMSDLKKALQRALEGGEEEIRSLLHHPSSQVISQLMLNPRFTDDHARIITNRRNISSEILEMLYQDRRWKDSYRILLSLSRNPKTPQYIQLSIISSLRVCDLADFTRNKQISINVRMKAELHILEKILQMPLGIKKTLARRASNTIVTKLIEDGMKEVVPVCLESPFITEGDICKVLSMKKVASHVVRLIAEHPKWSSRYHVMWALILHNHAPLVRVVEFLKKMKTQDLSELYALPNTPISTRPFVYRELLDRGESVDVTH